MTQQGLQAAPLHPGDARILALPEVAVVHQHHVGLGLHRGIQQRLAGGHAADDAADLRPPLDLQAIGAVVSDAGGIEKAVGFLHQGVQGDGHGNSSSNCCRCCPSCRPHLYNAATLRAASGPRNPQDFSSMLKALRFLGWPLLAGLLLALLLIQRYPQWVGLPANEVNLQQAPQYGIAQEGPVSYAEAVGRAAPAVANLYTTKMVSKSSHPLLEDPVFRRFFGDNLPKQRRMESSLGSAVIMSPEGLPADQQPCGGRRRPDRGGAQGRPRNPGPRDRQRPGNRPGGTQDRPDEPAGDDPGPLRPDPDRRRHPGHRQPLRRRPDRDHGHHQRHRAQPAGPQYLRGLHPDRRSDQPGQLRRRPGRCPRQPDRHQHGDLLQVRRLPGHRLRHPGQAGARGDEGDHRARPGDPRLAGHRSTAADPRTGRILRPAGTRRHPRGRHLPRRPGAEGRPAARRPDSADRRRTRQSMAGAR